MAVDASGTFSETKRQAGLLRMLQAGVIVSDYTTLNDLDGGNPERECTTGGRRSLRGYGYGMAKLVGQIAQSYEK